MSIGNLKEQFGVQSWEFGEKTDLDDNGLQIFSEIVDPGDDGNY
jgi:hypothetical protein